ncbi:MAG TPA: hopanoid-associated sugar epimerase [Rhizomicrobium sp.]|jgi:dihydroflavonol-4-reductase
MSNGDPVLVTGVSGFVGSAVARLLHDRGFAVRALVRKESNRGNLQGLDCEVVEGDMRDPVSMRLAMRGVRYLFHVAADYRLWARDPGEIVRNNLVGTRMVMEAAAAGGVERIVYTSSVATLKPGTRDAPSDETNRLSEAQAIGAYKRSKVAAERVVEAMIAERGLPAIIVNPSTPIGPRDAKPTPTGRVIVEAASGRMPAFVDTGLNLAHVDDVATGHLLAFEKGRIGTSYILGGQNVGLRDMLGVIATLSGKSAPKIRLPRAPLFPLALIAEGLARVTGKEPLLTRDALRMAGHHMFFSSTRAETELGYRARPYREALADAIGWYRDAGYLQ